MSVRDTSREAYAGINKDGTARTQRGRVLIFIRLEPYVSRAEIANYMGIGINAACGRVKELLDSGLIIEDGRKQCRVTGHTAYALKPSKESL